VTAVGTLSRPSVYQRQPKLNWEIRASLGSSMPEVKLGRTFSGTYPIGDLPGFDLFFVVVLLLLVIFVVVVEIVVVVIEIIRIVDILKRDGCDAKNVSGHAGLALSRAGGGYVVQK
jgi:hypothetical protein